MKIYNVGLDIGSTTAKLVVSCEGNTVFSEYARHMAKTREKSLELLKKARPFMLDGNVKIMISGSAGLGLSNAANIPYIQEVFATGELVKNMSYDTDIVVELGGEDAKIIYFKGALDERMNGSCAGGTGAFIDQMASLMDVTPDELDTLSLKSEQIYPIASRCGVFAKTDIQPLINQGARKEDIAASIYQAVVNQTIAGLARGRKIEGKVMFLGGPLYYNKGLRKRFTETLKLTEENALFPDYGRFSVAMGAAFCSDKNKTSFTIDELIDKIENAVGISEKRDTLEPLFENKQQYDEFLARHGKADVKKTDIETYKGDAFLGIDCGSTTTKLALIDADGGLLYTYYASNKGNPVSVVKEQLEIIRKKCKNINIAACTSTGYGEELVKNAFRLDFGLVETAAHLKAAKHFDPEVEFLIDIGGQDIKCFKIKDGVIDNIMLNEACSSGCGSFLETFAHTMNMSAEEFSKIGLFSKAPVNLGSRCTVFMNSSVKEAQKNGASVEDISAGLSCSVVNNALYKVIRINNPDDLGRRIVVQGGTFNNDAVLRSFEMQTKRLVTRPSIAGIMGAYGAALYAKEKRNAHTSSLLTEDELNEFVHTAKTARCAGCENRCTVTVNTFSGGRKFISGNRCEKIFGAGAAKEKNDLPDIYKEKQRLLYSLEKESRGDVKVGIPMALNLYETAPFWHAFFTHIGCNVFFGGGADVPSYMIGQQSIPSDTACYPAKLVHGQMIKLIEQKPDFIFYPCMTWNFDEKKADNCYNCPLVAYYPEVVRGNMDEIGNIPFLYPYLDINNKKQLESILFNTLKDRVNVKKKDISEGLDKGFEAVGKYREKINSFGKDAVRYARENNLPIMVLAGRPYHTDPLINHGINELATRLGFVVISEDAAASMADMPSVSVLNQWTYHSRMYSAANFVNRTPSAQLVQLVSFGCGLDAITTDEIRDILARGGKLYTQLKIDEITNLGAVTIRLRSLIAALEEQREKRNG